MLITQYDVDDAVERGTTAEDLLLEHMPTAAREFKKHIAALNKLLKQVRRVFPDANYYLDDDNMNLMLGESHDETRSGGVESRRMHRSACSMWLTNSGGGGQ